MPDSDTVKLPNGSEFILRLPYSDKEAHGMIALIVISAFSMVAVVGLLAGIGISAWNTRNSEEKHLFVKTHVFAYFICFLLSDFLQAIGGLMNSTWVRQRAVTYGESCTAQGVLKEMADVSSAFWTLVIAIHTFCLLVIEIKLRTFVLWTTLVGGWSAIFAIVISGPAIRENERGPFYAISEYWCWINPNYSTDRLTLDYLLMFMAASIAFILYALIYLKLRGNMIIEGHKVRFVKVSAEDLVQWREKKLENQSLQIAMRMWIYPMAYIILILPHSISRFAAWSGHKVSFEVTIFTSCVFMLIGITNVTLFLTTRPVLPPKSMRPKISAPTLLKGPSARRSGRAVANSKYQSALDPYYAGYFDQIDLEGKYEEDDDEKNIDAHEHHPDSGSEYSVHSAHTSIHERFNSMQPPPVSYHRGRDRRRTINSESEYSFKTYSVHSEGYHPSETAEKESKHDRLHAHSILWDRLRNENHHHSLPMMPGDVLLVPGRRK